MRVDRFDGLAVFLHVAERRSFSAAAKDLGVTPQAVSQSIRRLEAKLGILLFARTTREVVLTEAGQALYASTRVAAEAIDNALEVAQTAAGKPAGLLRINLPYFAACELEPLITGFCALHPAVRLELFVHDGLANIVDEGFDAGVRLEETLSGDMTCVRITGPVQFLVVGAPSYFARHGRPQRPEDLSRHNCINFRLSARGTPYRWEFEEDGREFEMSVTGSLMVNDSRIALDSASAGLGLHYSSAAAAAAYIARGDLEPVLQPYCPTSDGFFLYYPTSRFIPPKLRAFIDFASAQRPRV